MNCLFVQSLVFLFPRNDSSAKARVSYCAIVDIFTEALSAC